MSDPMPTAADFEAVLFRHVVDVWKDASHDGRAWLYCISALRA